MTKRDRGFDRDQFQQIFDAGSVEGDTTVRVGVWRYGEDGAPKIRIDRVGTRKNNDTWVKPAKGLSADEAEAVAPLLVKAAKWLKKQ